MTYQPPIPTVLTPVGFPVLTDQATAILAVPSPAEPTSTITA